MKKIRIFAGIAAAAAAAMTMTAVASAYDFNDKDLGKNWSLNAQIPASEFADITADSYITITFTADPDETEYWCIKPCTNTTGWPFIVINDYLADGEEVVADAEVALNNNGINDSFSIADADVTSVTFKVASGAVDLLKESGMVIMGHSIVLHEMTISDEAPSTSTPGPSEDNNTSGDDTGSTSDPTDDKQNPDTGIEGVAIVAGVALLAASAVVISRKRK